MFQPISEKNFKDLEGKTFCIMQKLLGPSIQAHVN